MGCHNERQKVLQSLNVLQKNLDESDGKQHKIWVGEGR